MLDKLTYAGNRANLEGVDASSTRATSPTPTTSRNAADGCDAIVNFAAETHVDRSILGATEFIRTDVLGTQVLLEHVRESGIRFVQVSTDEVYGDIAPGGVRARRTRSAEAVEPVPASQGRRRPAGARRTCARSASTRRSRAASNTYGPNQYPEKLIPLFVTNALDGRAAAALRRRPADPRLALRRGSLRRRSSSCCARARRARPTTSAAARSARTSRSRTRSSTLPASSPDLLQPRRGPPRPRPPLRARHVEAARPRLVAADVVRQGGLADDGRLVPRATATGGSRSSRASSSAYYERQYAARLAG